MENNTDKLLYSISSLVELSESLISPDAFSSNANAILHQILGTLLISKGIIFYYDSQNMELNSYVSKGLEGKDVNIPLTIRDSCELIKINTPLELAVDADLMGDAKSVIRKIKKRLPDAYLWTNLSVKDEFVGSIVLGKKFMGEELSAEDIDFLKIISRSVAVTIFNYNLIKDLNRKIMELQSREDELKKRKLELEILYDVGLEVTFLGESVEEISEKILDHAVSLLDARSGILLLFRHGTTDIQTIKNINVDKKEIAKLEEDIKIIKYVLNEKTTIIRSAGNSKDTLFPQSELIATPIIYKNSIHGIFILHDKESRKEQAHFTEDDKKILAAFANQAAVAVENSRLHHISIEKKKLEREIELAAEIQRELIPDSAPKISGFDIDGICMPCHTVGGDFYNYFPLEDGRLLIVVADVSGKGVPASLLVSSINSLIYGHLELKEYDLQTLVSIISRAMYMSSTAGKYATAFFLELNPEDANIKYINAGHNFPIMRNKEMGEIDLKEGGFCLGMFDRAEYKSGSFMMKKNDLVVVYTDGITEQIDKDENFYGEERLNDLIDKNRTLEVKKLNKEIISSVYKYSENQVITDDMTVLSIIKTAG